MTLIMEKLHFKIERQLMLFFKNKDDSITEIDASLITLYFVVVLGIVSQKIG